MQQLVEPKVVHGKPFLILVATSEMMPDSDSTRGCGDASRQVLARTVDAGLPGGRQARSPARPKAGGAMTARSLSRLILAHGADHIDQRQSTPEFHPLPADQIVNQ